jgi:hypothetical protein
VQQATYALKLLQSDGELKIASTGKDESDFTWVELSKLSYLSRCL